MQSQSAYSFKEDLKNTGRKLIKIVLIVGVILFIGNRMNAKNDRNSSYAYNKSTTVSDARSLYENKQENGKPKKKIGTDLKRNHKLPERSSQKAMQRFVDEVKKEAVEKVVDKQIESVKEKINKSINNTKENVPQYDKKERQSLDNMVEEIMEKGE